MTHVYVRVLRIESESSLVRNLNHVNAVHVRSPGRSRSVGMAEAATYSCMPLRRAARPIVEIAESQSGRPESPERLRGARLWLEANRRGIKHRHPQLGQVPTRARTPSRRGPTA